MVASANIRHCGEACVIITVGLCVLPQIHTISPHMYTHLSQYAFVLHVVKVRGRIESKRGTQKGAKCMCKCCQKGGGPSHIPNAKDALVASCSMDVCLSGIGEAPSTFHSCHSRVTSDMVHENTQQKSKDMSRIAPSVPCLASQTPPRRCASFGTTGRGSPSHGAWILDMDSRPFATPRGLMIDNHVAPLALDMCLSMGFFRWICDEKAPHPRQVKLMS